jgi:hypothetical protein
MRREEKRREENGDCTCDENMSATVFAVIDKQF